MTVNPQANTNPTNPTNAEPTSGSQELDWNVLVDPATGKVMGKYESPQAARDGYWNLVNHNKQVETENAVLREQLSRMTPTVQTPQRGNIFSQFDALGLPGDDLAREIEERAAAAVNKLFEPINQTISARTKMVEQYPNYAQDEAAMLAYANSDPRVAPIFSELSKSSPMGALEFGYAQYRLSQNKVTNTPESQANRAAAGMPSTSGAGSQRNAANSSREQKLAEAYKHWQETGDDGPYREAYWEGRPLLWHEHLQQK